MDKLIKITSLTKKIVVALLGAFLLLFLLFHASANLLVLSKDGGTAYSAFCHFMGSNVIVKIFEVVLLGCLALHIILTLILWFNNQKARPVCYHVESRTKTALGSKLTIYTGVLILCFLALHFFNFYFVKMNIVEGSYMTRVEAVQTDEVIMLQQATSQFQSTPEEFMQQYEQQLTAMKDQMPEEQYQQLTEKLEGMKRAVPAVAFLDKVVGDNMISADHQWIKKIDKKDKQMLEKAIPNIELEPDFYYMVRNLFGNKVYVCIYLLCFIVLWFHMRHAFEAAFQTLGLSNYKYARAIEIIGIIYAWCICLAFAIVPIGVLLF